MQSVVVTGARGFIGSHLVDALLARGDRVTALDDGSNARHDPPVAVESVDDEGATIVSVTDSLRVNSPPNSASSAVLAWGALAASRAVRFRVAPNGSASSRICPTAQLRYHLWSLGTTYHGAASVLHRSSAIS